MSAPTLGEIEALEQAIRSGTSRVVIGDRQVFYRTQNDMMAALSKMKQEYYGTDDLFESFTITYSKGL